MSVPHPLFPLFTIVLIDPCLLLQSPRFSSFVELPQLVRFGLVRTLGCPHLWGRPLRIRLRVVVDLPRSIPQRLDCRLPPPTWRSHRVPELCSYPSLSALTRALVIDVTLLFLVRYRKPDRPSPTRPSRASWNLRRSRATQTHLLRF